MKLKYYLRGLGVGIICTAIIMGIATSGREKEKLTDAEIVERARILGMVMAEENEEESKKAELKEEIKEDTKEKDSKDTPKESQKDSQKDSTEKDKQDNQKDSQKDSTEKDKQPEQTKKDETAAGTEMKKVEVLPGEYSDVVSQKLFDAGLITDAVAFNKYLSASGKDQTIMPGVHQIPMGANQEEIIRILGEKPEKSE